METGTFPQDKVSGYINKYFVPLKYESGRDAEQFQRFAVRGTPTFIILNADGDELHRMIGYLAPDDFLQQVESARSKLSQ